MSFKELVLHLNIYLYIRFSSHQQHLIILNIISQIMNPIN